MLGKLIKNEYKATARAFLPLYLVLIVVTILNKIMLEVEAGAGDAVSSSSVYMIITTLLMITFFLTLFAVGVLTVILIIKRFYDNMLKDEGYLSFTLPVTTGQHLISKILVSYSWFVLSILLIIAAVFTIESGFGIWHAFTETSQTLWTVVKEKYMTEFICVAVLVIFGIYNGIVMPYTCFSIGQRFTNHKVLGAFLTYMAIYMINQAIGMVFLSAMVFTGADMILADETKMLHYVLFYSLGLEVVEGIVCTVITYFMLDRKLNLE